MPQIFQVLRCYKCSVFQVHQTKKASNKFACKLCGEKQSIKRHYGVGTAKDCRLHVQKLNGIRKDIDELNNTISSEEEPIISPSEVINKPVKSKWMDYVEKIETKDIEEIMYLDNKEVVLEVPKKKHCNQRNYKENNTDLISEHFSSPFSKNKGSDMNSVADIAKHIDFLSQSSFTNCAPNTKISVNYNHSKESANLTPKNTNINTNNLVSNSNVTEDRILATKHSNSKVPVSKFSKWTQFIDGESVENENSSEDLECVIDNKSETQGFKNTKALFSLCEDNEIDHILEIE